MQIDKKKEATYVIVSWFVAFLLNYTPDRGTDFLSFTSFLLGNGH